MATKACLIGGMDTETADDGTIYMTLVTRFSTWGILNVNLTDLSKQKTSHSVQNGLRYFRYDKSKPLQPLASPHSRHYLIQALMTFDYALMHPIKRDFAKCMLLLGK